MNFQFFAFLIFMSFVSFAIAFLAYGMVVRFLGKTGALSRWSQIILIPACIVFFDFICIAAPSEYRYYIGSVPLLLVGAIAVYYYFFKGESFLEEKPTPTAMVQASVEPKKLSKKSQRIHAARKKRGRE